MKNGNSNDLYADSTLVGVFPLPGDDLPTGDDTDLHAVAMFPDVSYG